MPDVAAVIDEIHDHLVDIRHDLHAHPELAFEEKRTAARVLTELTALGNLKIRTGLAGTGITALLNADHPGPCVALRADMDALPLQEQNAHLSYASTVPGKMHACGHDGHTTCLLGAAMVLARLADELPGKVKFIFQPAEENGGGGGKLVEELGVLDNPTVAAAFALHGWPQAKVGQVMVGAGPVLAAATSFDVIVRGQGAHAAYPHTGTDVVLASAEIVSAVQAIASRWDPVDPVLVSVCQLQAGHTYNVLPDECRMKGTVRGLRQGSHDTVLERLREVIEGTAALHRCTAELELVPGYPALVNDPTCADLVARVAGELFGADAVDTEPAPGMGAEDFSFYARRVPSTWYRVGVADPDGSPSPALHNPQYDFHDGAIDVGVRMHCEIVRRFLADPPMWRCG
ncbi:MAG: amidohydrolase [Planctomycetes bacterium]|nr:amidohydrolase [Planctomycetota bacterium]